MTTTQTKHEWRKQEREVYGPKPTPSVLTVPRYKFIRIRGQGDPNKEPFRERIQALYPIAYGIKMTAKKPGLAPEGAFEYTVYPLEGVWDIGNPAEWNDTGAINKDDLVYELMLRQPDFVTEAYFLQIRDQAQRKKPNPLFDEIEFVEFEEGPCVQMLHIGPFDTEPASFRLMEQYAREQGLVRTSKVHREIYLSDFRKTALEKLKTVLRFNVDEA